MNNRNYATQVVTSRVRRRNSKMKICSLINFKNGIELIGMRASGVHCGRPIEKTVWMPAANISFINPETLIQSVKEEYMREAKLAEESISNENSHN